VMWVDTVTLVRGKSARCFEEACLFCLQYCIFQVFEGPDVLIVKCEDVCILLHFGMRLPGVLGTMS